MGNLAVHLPSLSLKDLLYKGTLLESLFSIAYLVRSLEKGFAELWWLGLHKREVFARRKKDTRKGVMFEKNQKKPLSVIAGPSHKGAQSYVFPNNGLVCQSLEQASLGCLLMSQVEVT